MRRHADRAAARCYRDEPERLLSRRVPAAGLQAALCARAHYGLWLAEIRLRAMRRLGQLTDTLETGAGRPSENSPTAGRITKASALDEAEISSQYASRCGSDPGQVQTLANGLGGIVAALE